MTLRTVAARVKAAQSEFDDSEFRTTYLQEVRTNWRQAETDCNRFYMLFLALAAVSVLLSSNSVEELTVGGVKFKNFDLVQKALPVLLAYLTYSIVALAGNTVICQFVHDLVMSEHHGLIFANDLEAQLGPPNSLLSAESASSNYFEARTSRMMTPFILLKNIFFLAAPFLVTGFIAWQLIQAYGFRNGVAWLSVGLTLIVLSYAGVILVSLIRLITTELRETAKPYP